MSSSLDFEARVCGCIQQVSQDGTVALAALFDLAAHRLVRFATTIATCQQDAEDAVQSVLVRLAGDPRGIAKSSSPWAYLLRMVRNEVLQQARRTKRLTNWSNLNDLVTRCPVDEVEREESYQAVWAALRSLPSEQAEVVVLKIWEGMTFAKIAEILEISPNTAASRYQYAMVKLSKRLIQQQGAIPYE